MTHTGSFLSILGSINLMCCFQVCHVSRCYNNLCIKRHQKRSKQKYLWIFFDGYWRISDTIILKQPILLGLRKNQVHCFLVVVIYVLLAGFVALPPLSTDPMYPSPILLNFCWWCYHLCSTVFCQAWAMPAYIWNLCKEEVFVEYPYPPPSPTEYSLRSEWGLGLCILMNYAQGWESLLLPVVLPHGPIEAVSRLSSITLFLCAAPMVDCLWISLALCYLWSLSIISHFLSLWW